jgi:hypothetical protein
MFAIARCLLLEELRILDTGLGWKCTDEREPVVTFAGREIKAAQWQRYVLFLSTSYLTLRRRG